MCHAIHRYATVNNKYVKNYGKESSCLICFDPNNLYGWAASSKLSANEFKWKRNTTKLDENVITNCNEDSDKWYILEVDGEYPKTFHNFHNDAPFLPKGPNIRKSPQLVCNQ